jgi:hypothetical protein
MTARVIRESYEGGQIEVDTTTCPGHADSRTYVSVDVVEDRGEAGTAAALLYLTRAESDELIDALIAANQEIDVAALAAEAGPEDTRSEAPPVAEDRATAAEPSIPPAELGRPDATDGIHPPCTCGACKAIRAAADERAAARRVQSTGGAR